MGTHMTTVWLLLEAGIASLKEMSSPIPDGMAQFALII